jgi:hypothetical protein
MKRFMQIRRRLYRDSVHETTGKQHLVAELFLDDHSGKQLTTVITAYRPNCIYNGIEMQRCCKLLPVYTSVRKMASF